MTPLQVWIEGYKARGEACKQGAIVSTVFIVVLAASIKQEGTTFCTILGIIFFALAIACSALAYLLSGLALTNAASSKVIDSEINNATTKEFELKDILLFKDKDKAAESRYKMSIEVIKVGNVFGIAEIFFLIIGLVPTVLSLTKIC